MALWTQYGLQEGITHISELICYFHDYIIFLLVYIILVVSYGFYKVISSEKVRRYSIDSHYLETIWTVVPMLFLVLMALPSLFLLYLTEDSSYYGLSIKAIAHQWYWEYEYSGSGMSYDSYMLPSNSEGSYRLLDVDNRVVLPLNISTIVVVTSADVLHSWAVPSLGVKADAIPGRLNYLNITPLNSGLFYGQCSELCGANHSFMPIVVEVVPTAHVLSFIKSL